MKDLFGGPGSVSGLMLRIGQCVCAAASIGWMASTHRFSSYTAFSYLIATMALQMLWSFVLACADFHALRIKKDLKNVGLVSLFVVGDWVSSILSLAAVCSCAGVVVLYARDTGFCTSTHFPLQCTRYEISTAMAFFSWFFLAISAHVNLWLLASASAN